MPRDIDRTTTHRCPGLDRDREYFARMGRPPLGTCVNCEQPITVHYVQYGLICADCRLECLSWRDVRHDTTCHYCEVPLC